VSKKSRTHIKALSDVVSEIDKIDDEVEQVQRVKVRLLRKRTELLSQQREIERQSDIELEDKPGHAGA
jgi:hypothetical protein